MSGMDMQRREASKRGWMTAGAGVLTVLGFVFVHWSVGLILLAGTGYLGGRYFLHRAKWGMRFKG